MISTLPPEGEAAVVQALGEAFATSSRAAHLAVHGTVVLAALAALVLLVSVLLRARAARRRSTRVSSPGAAITAPCRAERAA